MTWSVLKAFKLTKNKQKIIQKHWYLSHWIHYNQKNDDYKNIYIVNPFYVIIGKVDGFTEEKMETNT